MSFICPAGHHVITDALRKVHELCGDPARRHPQVTFHNAAGTQFERLCYLNPEEAYDHMASYWPFNNTRVSPGWCELAHCPHGCRTVGPRQQPVVQDVVYVMVSDRPVPNGRFRCPACQCEHKPGERPGVDRVALTQTLTDLGLEQVRSSEGVEAVTAVIPPGNRDAAGWTVKILQTTGAGLDRGRVLEPLLLALFTKGDDLVPASSHAGLTAARLIDTLRGYL